MTQNKVELAEKLSKESHQGQKYGPHDYFDYHIKGVVNSLIEHQFSEVYIITALLHDSQAYEVQFVCRYVIALHRHNAQIE